VSPPPALPKNVVATVGDAVITRSALEEELQRRGAGWTKSAVLEELIRFQAALAQAKAEGYDRRPEVRAAIERLIVARFQEDRLAGMETQAKTGEAEIREYYAQHAAEFTAPAKVRAAVIQWNISSKAEVGRRAEIARQAEAMAAQARQVDAAGFSRLVQQHSEDQSTRYRGGDAGWLVQDEAGGPWESEVIRQAFALPNPGAVSGVIETPRGFYVARLLERKPASVPPLEEVRDRIAYTLSRQKREKDTQAHFDQLKSGLRIEIYQEVLKAIPEPKPDMERHPPGAPQS
jgi:peptidylprolyl isomerase